MLRAQLTHVRHPLEIDPVSLLSSVDGYAWMLSAELRWLRIVRRRSAVAPPLGELKYE